MEKIQTNSEHRVNVLVEAVNQLKPVLEELKEKEQTIGQVLSQAIKRARMQERIIGDCPDRKTGKLMILYSRKTRKRFIGCTNYFKGICTTSFPLPQKGTAKPAQKNCKGCEWPLVFVRMRGKRPWALWRPAVFLNCYMIFIKVIRRYTTALRRTTTTIFCFLFEIFCSGLNTCLLQKRNFEA